MAPCWTISPARITASRSATVNASSWSWVTISAVIRSWVRIARRSVASRCRSPASRAECGQRLVEQQQPGAYGEAPGQRDPLPLAPGQGGGQPVVVPLEADELEQ